jgi:chemotaxis protein methyltransferase CheR
MSITTSDFQFVAQLVRQRAAIVLETGDEFLVESRLALLARRQSFPSLDGLIRTLRDGANEQLLGDVVEAMTANETSFFRDPLVFDALKQSVLPELIIARRPRRQLSLWCAAASSGQEPYSMAMLLRESFPETKDWSIRLTASDISHEMLARAREGVYSQLEVNRGLAPSWLTRYFEPDRTEWIIKDELRRMIDFKQINLIDSWPPLGPCDLILMRNVLLYFDRAAKRSILAKVAKVLAPDGLLVLGAAETAIDLSDLFDRISFDRLSCYRRKSLVEIS